MSGDEAFRDRPESAQPNNAFPAELSSEGGSGSAAAMTPDELAEARLYGRLSLVCQLAEMALGLVYLAVVAGLVALPLDDGLARCPLLQRSWTLRLIVLAALVSGGHTCLLFPLSFYSGYVLEHRFGLSTLSLARWLWRRVKAGVLAGLLGLALVVGLYWIIWLTGGWWWLPAAGAFFLVSVVLGQLVPVLILPLFYTIQRLDRPDLSERLARLAKGTGLTIEGVYRMALSEATVKANAMLAGLGRTRRVLLGDTLLDRFTPDEIEVIFAHEVGHHVYRHIYKMLVAGLITSAAGFGLCDWLLWGWAAAHFPAAQRVHLPVASLPVLMLILTVFFLLLEPLQNAVSRHFERQCDRYALRRTGLRAAYRSAFGKLARLNKGDPAPPWLEVVLLHSHPPIAQRLAMADEAKG